LKKTNLCVSADVVSCVQLLKLADSVGPYVCMIKLHVDILADFALSAMTELQNLARKHNFIIFEDRKFADIGNTVRQQYVGGVYHISSWADVVNAHALPGPGVVDALQRVDPSKGCILIAQMSSAGNLLSKDYEQSVVNLAKTFSDFVIGFICTTRVSDNPSLLHFTPGVSLESAGDDLGQQYLTPAKVIAQHGCDVIIVGRGITQAADPEQAARAYRDAGYEAYTKCVA